MRITKEKTERGLLQQVKELAGVDLRVCFQCKKCSSGCPVGDWVESPPAQIMRRLHLGAGDELLESDLVWVCVSCQTCSARCPMGIDVAAVMDALRTLALEKGADSARGTVPKFNRAFLGSVRRYGRTYDMGMIASYKFRTFSFMKDTDKFPQMLKKRKIALLPSFKADRKTVKRIFKTTQRPKGGQK
ncbi:MAG: 4Fe-4S dicluster domain-containing protein [Sedimentisphaerales bacterium]|nr:4Fe-4S dicluster domain-containing protein [Sedimentisphaerales bacterium]